MSGTGDVVKILDREESRCHAMLMKQSRSEKYVGFCKCMILGLWDKGHVSPSVANQHARIDHDEA